MQVKPNWRVPAGIAIILALILVWSVAVVSTSVLIEDLPWPVHAIYYLAAGILWVLPVRPLLRWMSGDGR